MNLKPLGSVWIPVTTAILALLLPAQEPNPAEWIRALGDDDPATRLQAEEKLIELGRDAVPALRAAAGDPDPEVRDRVRWLLGHPRLLPVDDPLAEAIAALASHTGWHAAVRAILKFDRGTAREALKACLPYLDGAARFRAKQLIDILSSSPRNGLIYGIVVSSPEAPRVPSGLEIWINVSRNRLGLEGNMGKHEVDQLEKWGNGGWVDAAFG